MKPNSDVLRPVLIFLLLLILVGWGVLSWRVHENRRPLPVELRIVSATDADPVYREGARHLDFDEELHLALAIRLEYPGRGHRWLAPVEDLDIDGSRIKDVVVSQTWPEEDRFLRAFWFTVESPFLGGVLQSKEDAQEKLELRPFLAPEMGHGLIPEREPDWHAEDDVDLGENLAPAPVGCYRLYAKIQLLRRPGSTHPLYALSSPGVEAVGGPRMLEISRDLPGDFGLDPAAGRVFRLPGFEAAEGSGLDPISWTRTLRAVSSKTFASMAIFAREEMGEPSREIPLRFSAGTFFDGSKPMRWGKDVSPRDLLRLGTHWIVLLKDDGNGILDTGDVVAQSWKRPPAVLHLKTVFDPDEAPLRLIRRESLPE